MSKTDVSHKTRRRIVPRIHAGNKQAVLASIFLGLVAAAAAYRVAEGASVGPNNAAGSLIEEILRNCGAFFASPMVFFAVAGTVYLFWITYGTQWIPSRRRIGRDSQALLRAIGPTNTAGEAADSQDDPVARIVDSVRTSHPWLRDRIQNVLETLQLQGPESARHANESLSEQAEGDVAADLIWPQICEWILPLFGFLGTVWGLHLAIPPLKSGVETMVKSTAARSISEAMLLRESAMAQFGDGFDGLRTAFDTTMFGLVGVMLVGLTIYLLRKRAVMALSLVQELVNQAVNACPTWGDSMNSYLARVLRTVNLGLVHQEKEEDAPQPRVEQLREAITHGLFAPVDQNSPQAPPQPLIAAVQETIAQGLLGPRDPQHPESPPSPLIAAIGEAVTRGLMHVPPGQKEPRPVIPDEAERMANAIVRAVENAAAAVCHKVLRNTQVLGGIESEQLTEEQFHSLLLYRTIAPDLRALRRDLDRLVGKGKRPPPKEPPIWEPTIDLVRQMPLDEEICGLAISNGAAKACIGTYHRVTQENYVQETEIRWKADTYSLGAGIQFVEHSGGDGHDLTGRIEDVSYDSSTRRLFVICQGGRVRVFENDEMKESSTGRGILVSRPFTWVTGCSDGPLLGMWRPSDRHYEFVLVTLATGQPVAMAPELRASLARFDCEEVQDRSEVRLASDRHLLCIAGRERLTVGAYLNGQWNLVSECPLSQPVTALDVSAGRRFIIYAFGDGMVYRWQVKGKPERLILKSDSSGSVGGLYLSPDYQSLAVLCGPTIHLHELGSDEEHSSFATRSASVTRICQSLDRTSLLVATDDNKIMLFRFGMKILTQGELDEP